MENTVLIAQLILALGIFNVWLIRQAKPSLWRGGNANSLDDEFATYGLPAWFKNLIHILKVGLAIILIVGIWFPALTKPAAAGIALLMLGAIAMHFKVNDPLKKSAPATGMLLLASAIALL